MHDVYRRVGALTLVAGTLAIGACAPTEGEAAPTDESDGVRVVNVEVTPVTRSDFTDFIRVTGEIEALYDITLSAEESGAIARFLVEKGSAVRAGQVIIELDSDVLTAQVNEARAAADLAREEFERQRRLWEEEQIGSEIAYLRTRSAAEVAAARLAVLEARLRRTRVRTPVAGIFDDKFIEIGEMASPGTPLVRVVSVRQVKITGGIPERFGLAIRPGAQTRVTLDAFPGREFDGRIRFIATTVDRANRTIPIEVLMENPNGAAKPGMIANVQVAREQRDGVVIVPQQVVQRTESGYQVFVVTDRDGHAVAEARPVELGPSYRNDVVIDAGLEVGDRLITLGQQLVDAGSRVRIVNTAGAVVDARKDSD